MTVEDAIRIAVRTAVNAALDEVERCRGRTELHAGRDADATDAEARHLAGNAALAVFSSIAPEIRARDIRGDVAPAAPICSGAAVIRTTARGPHLALEITTALAQSIEVMVGGAQLRELLAQAEIAARTSGLANRRDFDSRRHVRVRHYCSCGRVVAGNGGRRAHASVHARLRDGHIYISSDQWAVRFHESALERAAAQQRIDADEARLTSDAQD